MASFQQQRDKLIDELIKVKGDEWFDVIKTTQRPLFEDCVKTVAERYNFPKKELAQRINNAFIRHLQGHMLYLYCNLLEKSLNKDERNVLKGLGVCEKTDAFPGAMTNSCAEPWALIKQAENILERHK